MLKFIAILTLLVGSLALMVILFRRNRRNKWLARRHAFNASLIWKC